MRSIFSILLFVFRFNLMAQDDLMDQLEKETKPTIDYTTATFKGTRLMNGQTNETLAAKHMNMWIQHRFGRVNSGFVDHRNLNTNTKDDNHAIDRRSTR